MIQSFNNTIQKKIMFYEILLNNFKKLKKHFSGDQISSEPYTRDVIEYTG